MLSNESHSVDGDCTNLLFISKVGPAQLQTISCLLLAELARAVGCYESSKLVFAGTDPHLFLIQVNDDATSVIYLPRL